MALSRIDDPEAGMNVVDLGRVYAIEIDEVGVHVDVTMTSVACPVADSILEQVRATVATMVRPGPAIDVRLVWDPPWTPDRMSTLAKEHFGWGQASR
jgi:metal-sulfur cluster biosynthetic enzyme